MVGDGLRRDERGLQVCLEVLRREEEPQAPEHAGHGGAAVVVDQLAVGLSWSVREVVCVDDKGKKNRC